MPSKFQSVMNEYLRQLCAKAEANEEGGFTAREDVPARVQHLLQTEKHSLVSAAFLTPMKQMDYSQIKAYLAKLEQKKMKKILKSQRSQDSKNREVASSRHDVGSDAANSDTKFQINNVTQITYLRKNSSKLGHQRGGSSITENLGFLGSKKSSRSLRRENVQSVVS